jgi:GAF domain-containing protein
MHTDDEHVTVAQAWLTRFLAQAPEEIAQAWLARWQAEDPQACRFTVPFLDQARRFLALLGRPAPTAPLTLQQDARLAEAFPLIYRVPVLLQLAALCTEAGDAADTPCSWRDFGVLLPRLLPALESDTPCGLPTRLGLLSRLTAELVGLRERDAILRRALVEVPALVPSACGACWLWDREMQRTVLRITPDDIRHDIEPPPAVLAAFRRAVAEGNPITLDADPAWPAPLHAGPLTVVPLPSPEGCIGLLTVGCPSAPQYSHEDLLLLSGLGALAAAAVRAAEHSASERVLRTLLQTSIHAVVRATADTVESYEDFTQSLLQVAEGLTHADAVFAVIELDDRPDPILAATGTLAAISPDVVARLHTRLLRTLHAPDHPLVGQLPALLGAGAPPHGLDGRHYTLTPIRVDGSAMGLLCAVSAAPLGEEETALLDTVAEQVGMGVGSMRRTAGNQRLLVQLANMSYVSQTITSTFDPRRIMATISTAAGQAAGVPIACCAWQQEDGTLQVAPHTAVGVADDGASLGEHHPVVRKVLESGAAMTSRAEGGRTRPVFPLRVAGPVADWACLPMVVKGRVRGIMLVADTQPHPFSTRELAVLSTYANQGALAMENSLLYDQVERQLGQMAHLYNVIVAVGSSLDLQLVYNELLEAATQAVGAPVGFVCVAPETATLQHVEAAIGVEDPGFFQERFAADDGIIGTAAQRTLALVSSNLARDGRSPLLRSYARAERWVSSLTVPLPLLGEALGTLTVITREPREFTAADQQLLRAMATDAAVAVQHARMYGQANERLAELRRLTDALADRQELLLSLVHQLCTSALAHDPPADALARTLRRLDGLGAMLGGKMGARALELDVRDGVGRRINQRRHAQPDVDLAVTGVHLQLPVPEALMLALLLDEYLDLAFAGGVRGGKVAFQQLGGEMIVEVKLHAADDTSALSWMPNRAIIDLAQQTLHARLHESGDADTVRLRVVVPRS